MVRHNQLPEWQEKSLSRLPDLDTADGVPNARNSTKKGDPCASAIRQRDCSTETKPLQSAPNREGGIRNHDSARLFDPSCQRQLEIPPVWANSKKSLDAAALASNGSGPAARCFDWSGLDREEFAPDTSASAVPAAAELLTVSVSGTSRRNGLGAIAPEKNDCNLLRRRQPRRATKRDNNHSPTIHELQTRKSGDHAQRCRCAKNSDENRFRLTGSFRKGLLDLRASRGP
jgi:hypothetical protein